MKATFTEVESYVGNVVSLTKMSNNTFTATRANIVELLDKIGKIFTVDVCTIVDKLAKFDGEYLSYGKTIEEWQADLKMPQSYAAISNPEDCLKPYYNTFRPVAYSYTLGKQYIPQSFPNNDIERAVHNEGEFQSIVAMLAKRLDDSVVNYRYAVKREMINKLITLAEDESNASNATGTYASSSYTTITLNTGSGAETYCYITFDTSAIPSNAVIDDVQCSTRATISSTTGMSSYTAQVVGENDTALSSAETMVTSSSSSTKDIFFTMSSSSYTLEDIQNLRMKFDVIRGTSNTTTSRTMEVYGGNLTVTYTVPNGNTYSLYTITDVDNDHTIIITQSPANQLFLKQT